MASSSGWLQKKQVVLVDMSTAVGTATHDKERGACACCTPTTGNGATGNEAALTSAAVHPMVQLFGQKMRSEKHTDGRTDGSAWQVLWPYGTQPRRMMLSTT